MSAAFVVLRKECVESLRDRRVLLNALVLGPLLMPALFLLLMHLIVGRERELADKPLPVVVVGGQYAPNLVAALTQQGMEARPATPDPEGDVRAQRIDLALRIPERFAQDWRAGRPAQVEVIFDSSRQDVRGQIERLQSMIETYSRRTGALRLLARGIAPTVIQPVVMASRDQATPQARSALLLGMLPYFLVLTALIGGMWLAIDATAGERERQSLEPLLANPVGRGQILLGKALATALFGMASLVLGLLAFWGAARLMPVDEPTLGRIIGPGFVASVLPVMAPLVLLIAIAQIWVASFARSFREAQTYVSLAQLVPLVPSMILMYLPMQQQLWMLAIPIFGQQLTLLRLLRGEQISAVGTMLCAGTTLAATAGMFWLTLRLFRSERMAISG